MCTRKVCVRCVALVNLRLLRLHLCTSPDAVCDSITRNRLVEQASALSYLAHPNGPSFQTSKHPCGHEREDFSMYTRSVEKCSERAKREMRLTQRRTTTTTTTTICRASDLITRVYFCPTHALLRLIKPESRTGCTK
ncbi:unnamed protein product [Trichogramma brassicae]|uniref:Secreted protein n=1 Tax=Trichogramma brassicae TaxID=86971 RepID=A0A6H5J282_9HYME|nr:unnamed protein product [Trichogramma brassicae]